MEHRDARCDARRHARSLACALSIALVFIIGAPIASAELPNPLSLERALSYAKGHPRVLGAEDPLDLPRPQPLFMGCHSLAFPNQLSLDGVRDGVASPLLSPLAIQQLEILQRYFDVLLADLSYASDNEAMAVAFIQFDRARSRAELGQTSPVRVAELEAEFQRILRQRAASDAARRLTRSRLAEALGIEDSLPRDLKRPTSDNDLLLTEIIDGSASFDDGASDDAGARQLGPQQGLQQNLPNAPDSLIKRALTDNPAILSLLEQADAQQARLVRLALQQEATELFTRLELLEVIARQTAVESQWRDLRLDESRTLYEMEAKADLGFSMSQQTRARRDQRQVAFCIVLTRAQLLALQHGSLIPSANPTTKLLEQSGEQPPEL